MANSNPTHHYLIELDRFDTKKIDARWIARLIEGDKVHTFTGYSPFRALWLANLHITNDLRIVRCGNCGAAPGTTCHTPSGKDYDRSHQARHHALRRYREGLGS
jgi:hypothetical protein